MTVATGPFTVRKWVHGQPGAIVEQDDKTILQTTTEAETQKLISGLQATLPAPAAPTNVTPPVITIKN